MAATVIEMADRTNPGRCRDGCGAEHGRRMPDERGVTTAEYAVATAAGAGFAGLLFKLLSGDFGNKLIKTLFDHVLSLLGLS